MNLSEENLSAAAADHLKYIDKTAEAGDRVDQMLSASSRRLDDCLLCGTKKAVEAVHCLWLFYAVESPLETNLNRLNARESETSRRDLLLETVELYERYAVPFLFSKVFNASKRWPEIRKNYDNLMDRVENAAPDFSEFQSDYEALLHIFKASAPEKSEESIAKELKIEAEIDYSKQLVLKYKKVAPELKKRHNLTKQETIDYIRGRQIAELLESMKKFGLEKDDQCFAVLNRFFASLKQS